MIQPTRPKLNRFKYAAMLAGAMAVAAFPHAGLTAVASAATSMGHRNVRQLMNPKTIECHPTSDRINGEPRQRVGVVNSFGEATYWHNHPDLLRLAQNMREQLEQQRMTVYESPR